jgi:GTP-binding protein Era
MAAFRSGMVAVVGRPNAGKSTLINTIVGFKVSIVSDKVQTTRRRVLGIATRPDWQIVFVDTPGVHKAQHRLGKALNETAQRSMQDVDAVLIVVDASHKPSDEDRRIAQMLGLDSPNSPANGTPRVVCLNKMDLLHPEDVETRHREYGRLFQTDKMMLTSFRKLQNVELLEGMLVGQLPEGPPHYSEDDLTDQSMRMLASELIREKVLWKTRQEVPHAVATTVESWEEEADIVRISATILVEREGQKAILIGKKGQMLKAVGTEARKEIEKILEKKVFLELFVKVREDWRENTRILRELELM